VAFRFAAAAAVVVVVVVVHFDCVHVVDRVNVHFGHLTRRLLVLVSFCLVSFWVFILGFSFCFFHFGFSWGARRV